MSKTIIPFTAKIVNFDTTLPFSEVISRLDVAINKAGSSDILGKLRTVKDQEEFMSVVNRATVGQDFLYFWEVPHNILLEFADGNDKRGIVVYTFGNPIFAQAIVKCNPFAAYSIPPRLLIVEKPEGTSVSYHLPSTVMSIRGKNDPNLQAELEALDQKVERLVVKITAI
ncbi:hypothetical protein CPB84DRAFT_1751602 [Gymnopilus junonius]|uniref:DUF302 domain-containing protein n=1 Tax=Gymnopilus junonius TaxID=109634 RepID=A0A9P5TIM6_GYMJU|nr:hypothetical protein CPB84DRAFT_1751602 [Gymnopilus junonius]